MRLSTSTNLIAYRPDWVSFIPITESLKLIKKAGFDAADINLTDAGKSFFCLNGENWRDRIMEIASLSQSLCLPFSQSHPPFYNALVPESEKAAEWEKMIKRAIEASGILGVKWVVMHPGTYPDDTTDFRESKRRNYEYFMPYLELAARFHCGIAIENMVDDVDASKRRRPGMTYGATYAELTELIDSFPADNVGICWDFGHAHLMGIDQRQALRVMGKRLKATHVADNSGARDDHILPFMGTIDWRKIMPVLGEIGYEGDFTYEIHNATSRLPDELIYDMALMCEKIGRWLVGLA